MKKTLRALLALSICISGWALVPFASLPTQAFGWEMWAEAYGEIFSDGFETGDTSRWSHVVGGFQDFAVASSDEFLMSFRLDGSNWAAKDGEPVPVASGLTDRDIPSFTLEARRRGSTFDVRARAVSEANVWAESPWRSVGSRYGALELEWRRAYEDAADGLLYLSVDGDLLLWLVDLDNAHLPMRNLRIHTVDRTLLAAVSEGTFAPEE
ncbi:MAG: hypothetical protein OES32_05800 [Acidobacteriota bacterium]|nr:hypothetical protein [Acidobacteriota bacterium]MDH3523081.1 hypothetical protein [Acidobacteriota bacterium]